MRFVMISLFMLPLLARGQSPPDASRDQPPGPPRSPMANAPDPLEGVKKQLDCTDEEWKVIGPQIRKVQFSQRNAVLIPNAGFSPPFGRGFRGFGGPGGRDSFSGPGGGPGPAGGPRSADSSPGPRPRPPEGSSPPAPDGRPANSTQAASAGTQPGNNPPPRGVMGFSPLAQAANELQAMIADQKSTPEQVQEKLAALRALKAKAQAALVAAQKELAELLTPEQQALMVSLGYLE